MHTIKLLNICCLSSELLAKWRMSTIQALYHHLGSFEATFYELAPESEYKLVTNLLRNAFALKWLLCKKMKKTNRKMEILGWNGLRCGTYWGFVRKLSQIWESPNRRRNRFPFWKSEPRSVSSPERLLPLCFLNVIFEKWGEKTDKNQRRRRVLIYAE